MRTTIQSSRRENTILVYRTHTGVPNCVCRTVTVIITVGEVSVFYLYWWKPRHTKPNYLLTTCYYQTVVVTPVSSANPTKRHTYVTGVSCFNSVETTVNTYRSKSWKTKPNSQVEQPFQKSITLQFKTKSQKIL